MPKPRVAAASHAWLEPLAELPRAGATAGSEERLAFELCGRVAENRRGLACGDVLVVAANSDAEVGDLVVWWTRGPGSLALAEVGEGYQLRAIAGFFAPRLTGNGAALRSQAGAEILGVVLGRVRRMTDSHGPSPRQGA
jgi:hypothetical protein